MIHSAIYLDSSTAAQLLLAFFTVVSALLHTFVFARS